MKKFLSAALAGLIIFSFSSCKKDTGGKVKTFETETAADTVDPLLCSNKTELTAVYNIFEPLVILEGDGTLSPGAAESYEISSDKLKITFNLREGACWSDGERVTADDFAYTLERAVDPVTKFSGASALSNIKNAAEISNGSMSASSLGVTASGNRLEVELSSVDGDIIYCFAGPAGMPCRRDVFEAAKGKYCMTKETTVSNGPFYVSRWVKSQGEEALKFIKNEHYVGLHEAVSQGVYCPVKKTDGRLDRLKNGNIDSGFLPSELVSSAQNGKNTLLSTYTSTAVLAFSTSEKSPLADSTLRRGLYMTADLASVSSVLPESCEQAGDIIPPGSICSAGIWRNDNPPDVQSIRSQETNDLISKSKDVLAQNKVVALTVAYETETDKAAVNYTVQNWQKQFGLKVETVQASRASVISGLKDGKYAAGIFKIPSADKMAATTLLELSSAGLSLSNSRFDEALAAAGDSYEKQLAAENILFEDCLVCPVYYEKSFCVFSENVTEPELFAMSGTVDFRRCGLE